jgi:hypothetical protein
MKNLVAACLIWSLASVALGQGRVAMSSPIIRSKEKSLFLVVSFSDFQPGSSYQLGIGSNGVDLTSAKIELTLGSQLSSSPLVSFEQGNTQGWWGTNSIQVRGYQLGTSVGPGQKITMSVQIPIELADQAKKLYLFVSRDYGENLWYLEDGIELTDQYW